MRIQTYLGVERTLFYFVCVGTVGAFNLFNGLLLAGAAMFLGGYAFGHWVTRVPIPQWLRTSSCEEYSTAFDREFLASGQKSWGS